MAEEKLPFDAGDPKNVGKRKTKAQLNREREVEELRVVLSTKGGRNVIWRLLSMTTLFHSPVGDTNDIMRAIGGQDIGREFLAEVFTSDPGSYILMQQEAKERDL